MWEEECGYEDCYEHDPDEEELKAVCVRVKNEFVHSYRKAPVNQTSFHLLQQAFGQLEEVSFASFGLKKSFIENSLEAMEELMLKKKFLTEVFLYAFKGLNLRTEPEAFLKVLYEEDTFKLAQLFCASKHYSFIMKFILEVVESAERKPSRIPAGNYFMDRIDHNTGNDGYSDLLYWETVHEGDIIPEAAGFDENEYDTYYAYEEHRFQEAEGNEQDADPVRIARRLVKYIKLLEGKTDDAVSLEDKKRFLTKFKQYTYTAEKQLYEIELQEHIETVLDPLILLGREAGLDVCVSESFDKTILFTRPDGTLYLKVTLFNQVNDTKSWGDNELNFRLDDVKHKITSEDLRFMQSVLQTIGYGISDCYIPFVKETLAKDAFFGRNELVFPTRLKLKLADHGNELRQFLGWQSS